MLLFFLIFAARISLFFSLIFLITTSTRSCYKLHLMSEFCFKFPANIATKIAAIYITVPTGIETDAPLEVP